MPIYEYTCKRCGDFEVMQRISQDPLKKCPTCGAKVTKLISRSAFHLKGSGWYSTDYARNGSSKSNAEESKATTSETKDNSAASTSSTSSSGKESKASAKENAAAT
jgi:putative FmdB family regulatory protein